MTDGAVGVDRAEPLKDLVKDLKRLVVTLEDDLRERTESEDEIRDRLTAEYRQAKEARRTAARYESWRDERVTQSAAAWVLACVFVRFCEDNGLIEDPFIAGPGERLSLAEARHEAFFRENPSFNNRDWLFAAFDHLAKSNPTAAGLFDRAHNPLYDIEPGYETATELGVAPLEGRLHQHGPADPQVACDPSGLLEPLRVHRRQPYCRSWLQLARRPAAFAGRALALRAIELA